MYIHIYAGEGIGHECSGLCGDARGGHGDDGAALHLVCDAGRWCSRHSRRVIAGTLGVLYGAGSRERYACEPDRPMLVTS